MYFRETEGEEDQSEAEDCSSEEEASSEEVQQEAEEMDVFSGGSAYSAASDVYEGEAFAALAHSSSGSPAAAAVVDEEEMEELPEQHWVYLDACDPSLTGVRLSCTHHLDIETHMTYFVDHGNDAAPIQQVESQVKTWLYKEIEDERATGVRINCQKRLDLQFYVLHVIDD